MSRVPVTIRDARPGDRAALGRLGALLMRVHHDFDRRRFLAPGRGAEEGYGAFLVSQLGRPQTIVRVAEHQGVVIGYAYAAVEPRAWQLLRDEAGVVHDLVVDPGYRRGGAGAALLAAVLADLRALGMRQIVLSTAQQNAAAQRLFARFGFRPTMIEMTCDLEDHSSSTKRSE